MFQKRGREVFLCVCVCFILDRKFQFIWLPTEDGREKEEEAIVYNACVVIEVGDFVAKSTTL